MKKRTRVSIVIAGACGMLLAAGGVSPAMAWDGGYGGFGTGGNVIDSDVWASFHSIIRCSPRARVCVNGPVNSGNTKNSQNVHMSGNNSDSGSPTNSNGNTNVDSGGTTGAENHTGNDIQHNGPGSTKI
ncbi:MULTISPECIES: hypothetical protein [unclassified Streptomyces]|uniref:Secreted protein n=2 Tax=Streptomyces TaxID=1883 RepID=A0ABS1MTN3_9ACTN|nr:hypothetical protein [Streptomyces sp. NRRL S-337]MBL1091137.1 hypothetical protein [Streptomyces sp. 9-7]